MPAYSLSFKPEDITRTLRDIHHYTPGLLPFVFHEMFSPFVGFNDRGSVLIRERDGSPYYLRSVLQRGYVDNLKGMAIRLHDSSVPLFKMARRKRFSTKAIDPLSQEFYRILYHMVGYMPVSENLGPLDQLTTTQKRILREMDMYGDMSIYSINGIFSSDFKRNEFYLDQDLNVFGLRMNKRLNSTGIRFSHGVKYIKTLRDYLTFAISPLVWNAVEHAFNAANDINNRSDTNFDKGITVVGHPEKEVEVKRKGWTRLKEPAPEGNYVITVWDNGFGIRPDAIPRLFEKGFSTKPDDRDHGIGLWGVKEFVEENGGSIGVTSSLGEGTSFEFTIPYRYESPVCIQTKVNLTE